MTERWADGDAYERYVGRWSRLVAVDFLDWLGIAPGRRWLDVGCGTGALTAAILDRCAPEEVLGIDPSPAQVATAAEGVPDPRARFAVGDATHLPEVTVDAVVSGLVLNFVPDPVAALEAMGGAAPGGVVAAYVWDYAGKMELIRAFWDTAVALDPAAAPAAEGTQFAMCRPDRLERLWSDAGMSQIAVHQIDVPTTFHDFDDCWTPFLGGQGPAPAYAMSLPESDRDRLREALRAQLPVAPDGSIHLNARAWAVRGRGPA